MAKLLLTELYAHSEHETTIEDVAQKKFNEKIMNLTCKKTQRESQAKALYALHQEKENL